MRTSRACCSAARGRAVLLRGPWAACAAFLAALLAGAMAASGAAGQTAALAAGTRAAPRVATVVVSGAESLSDRAVRSILVPDASAPFDSAALGSRVDSLLAVLADRGRPFAAARVAWADTTAGVRLRVTLDEGPEARLDSLLIVGLEAGGPAVASQLPGGALKPGAVQDAVQDLLEHYRTTGRPLASVRPGEARAGARGLELALVVDEGPFIRFDRVAVRGNTVTKTGVVGRETGIVAGDTYDERVIERVRGRLEKLGFFQRVEDPVVAFDREAGVAVVGVEVADGPASSIAGVLGYDAAEGGGEFTGFVDVALDNIAGTGRRAGAAWQRLTAGYTRASFSYTEPWFLGAPLDISVAGGQVVRDTLYTTTEGDLLVTARMGARTRVTWAVGGEQYVPGTGAGETTTTARTALGADYDGTDAPANPTRGVHIAGTVEYGAKKDEGNEKERSGTFSALAEAFLEVRPRQVLALAGRAAAISSTQVDVPLHEQLTLGGARSLRGYREEQFHGTRTALATVEYRFILTRRSRALAFTDLGYYYRGGSNSAKGVKVGYGIGLRADTRLGIIGVDYGLGEGDRLLDGKLHVGLSREF